MFQNGDLTEKDRVELIEGVIVAVSPQSEEHAFAIERLMRILISALGEEWAVRAQSPITLARSEPEPDILVFPQDSRREGHPRTASLVIEVAKTSIAFDRAMAALYAEAGVSEYWIVDVGRQVVEVSREPTPQGYRTTFVASVADSLRPVELPSVDVTVAALFRPTRH